jgi:hypothetical protein
MVSPSITTFFLPYTCLMGQLSKILIGGVAKNGWVCNISYPILYWTHFRLLNLKRDCPCPRQFQRKICKTDRTNVKIGKKDFLLSTK